MIKQNKKLLILTSIVMLIPIAIGLLLWNRLPDAIPSHWDIHGNVDGWSSKAVAVFGLPALLVAIQWLCTIACTTDPKHKNYHPKVFSFVLWICPVIGLCCSTVIYAAALGHQPRVELIAPLLVGALFIFTGNFLPKCRQTFTMGIRLPWTLASEENWNKTHRFAGKIWVVGGVLTMATAILKSYWILVIIFVVMVAAPTIYSYLHYRNHKNDPPTKETEDHENHE